MDRNPWLLTSILTNRMVALRKESVDRNGTLLPMYPLKFGSLSARRAWIEIIDYIIDYVNDASRSPQGERG